MDMLLGLDMLKRHQVRTSIHLALSFTCIATQHSYWELADTRWASIHLASSLTCIDKRHRNTSGKISGKLPEKSLNFFLPNCDHHDTLITNPNCYSAQLLSNGWGFPSQKWLYVCKTLNVLVPFFCKDQGKRQGMYMSTVLWSSLLLQQELAIGTSLKWKRSRSRFGSDVW